MTKEELLSMSEESYMNDEQLNFFKNLLLSQKNELLNIMKNAKNDLLEQEHNKDASDIASQLESQQLYLKNVDRQNKLLKKINKALNRIDTKEYGFCDITGEEIGLKRLLARPTTNLTIEAKEMEELRERTQGKGIPS